jgi:hypothetical protein
MGEQVREIWNPSVRDHFTRILNVMAPHFDGREDNYRSFMGMPDNGNPRSFVNTDAEMELFCHDHAPKDAYADWLDMRGALLFAHPIPQNQLIARLDQHFMARLMMVPCNHCGVGFHTFWASRFAKELTAICPVSGHREQIMIDDARQICVPGV